MKIITGKQAIDKMRLFRGLPKETFGLLFITNSRSKSDNHTEFRKYEHCRLRTAENREGLEVQSDHYLYFTDCDSDSSKMCWKKLIRQVCFGNIWYKINWFE